MGRCVLLCLWCVCITSAAEDPQPADWNRLIQQADAQVQSGNYDKALSLYREALRIAEPFGPKDMRLAATLDFLGNVYASLGLWSQSEREFQLALPMIESIAGRESVTYGLLMLDMGDMLGNSGRMDRAEPLIREAFALLTKLLPANDSRVAIVRASYATVLTNQSRYHDAEDLVRGGIAALEKQGKAACLTLGDSYSVLGLVMWRQGRFEEALPELQHAVDTVEACLGAHHPALLQPLNNLAVTLYNLHRTADAEAAFHKALSLEEGNDGLERHSSYARLLLNYAGFLRQTGRKNEAKKASVRAQLVLRENARHNGVGLTVDISTLRLHLR